MRRGHCVSPEALAHYRAHFLEALREDSVVCLECGAVRKTLGAHVILQHTLNLDEYRERWGYNRHTPFAAPETQEKMRRNAVARNLGAYFWANLVQRPRTAPEVGTQRDRPEARLAKRAAVRERVAAGWRPATTKVEDEALRALVAEGLTLRQIAARAGVGYDTVRRRIRALGLVSPAIPPFQPKATDEELLALRLAGLWPSQIAARTGLTPSGVKYRLRALERRGVPVPPPAGPRPNPWRRVSDEQLLALVRGGLRQAEMAARVGLSQTGVERRLRALRRRGLLPPARPGTQPKKLDDETLRTLIAEGRTLRQIAARTGLGYETVRHRVRTLGLVSPAAAPFQLKAMDAELLAFRSAGLWSSEIAARTGLTVGGVNYRLRALRRRGVAVPPPAGPVPHAGRRVSDERLLALAQGGLRISKIAAQVGIAIQSVSARLRALRRRGLLPPGGPPAQPL